MNSPYPYIYEKTMMYVILHKYELRCSCKLQTLEHNTKQKNVISVVTFY